MLPATCYVPPPCNSWTLTNMLSAPRHCAAQTALHMLAGLEAGICCNRQAGVGSLDMWRSGHGRGASWRLAASVHFVLLSKLWVMCMLYFGTGAGPDGRRAGHGRGRLGTRRLHSPAAARPQLVGRVSAPSLSAVTAYGCKTMSVVSSGALCCKWPRLTAHRVIGVASAVAFVTLTGCCTAASLHQLRLTA